MGTTAFLSLSLSQRRDASTGLGRRKILAVARVDGTVAFHGFFYAARIFRARKEFLLGRVISDISCSSYRWFFEKYFDISSFCNNLRRIEYIRSSS